jgi:hypothetical protein
MKANLREPRSGIRLPYAVPKFISEPQLLQLGLFVSSILFV